MRRLRVSVGVVVSFCILVAGLLMFGPGVALAQENPHSGTWVLNVAKSKYTPGPLPKEQTTVFTAQGDSFKASTKGTGPDGKPTMTEYTASFDGKDHPVKGNADWDMVAVKRIDSHTIEFTRKRGGKVVQTATSVVSKDGKTRTITATGVNAAGQKINNVGVYDKK